MPSPDVTSQPDRSRAEKTIGVLAGVARWLVFLVFSLWTAGAVYVDGPLGTSGNTLLALGWLAVAIACLLLLRRTPWKRNLAWFACLLVVIVPWAAKTPSNDRDWSPEWARTAWIELDQGALRFHNLRNFDYGADGEVSERWETRTVNLANLRGMDYFHVAFGGDFIAHPILSFDFGPDGRIALSVETRREVGESFSEIGGFYKMFELQYLWGDERDFIRVRTNLRNEPVYLYRTDLTPEDTLFVLFDSIRASNMLKERPRFYNVIDTNCTTSLLSQTMEFREAPFDFRMLANGRFDELIHEGGGFLGGDIPFEKMRQHAFINPDAQAAHSDPDFAARIRENRPGFE